MIPILAINRIVINKQSAVMGKRPAYWTINGITIFFFPDDGGWFPPEAERAPAMPGMVGIDYVARALYSVMSDGECIKLTDLGDEPARTIALYAGRVDQRIGEIANAK